MNRIWEKINSVNAEIETKNYLFLIANIIVSCLLGTMVWVLIGRIILPGLEWMLCLMGYPAIFIGMFGGIIYLYNHEFE